MIMQDKKSYVYIATNFPRKTVLYVGVTKSLTKRYSEHLFKKDPSSFTARYNVNRIVYVEVFGDIRKAIYREKQIKNLVRRKKEELINKQNPEWLDIVEKYCF
jgi:putative endonuclease